MTEIADSFCERCGTRYSFGATPPRRRSIARARLLAKAAKHFVLSDGTTVGEAIEYAQSDVDRELTVRMTEEFHSTFNFCMLCRQYTCERCWNERAAACLSCAPLAEETPADDAAPAPAPPALESRDAARPEPLAWPQNDLPRPPAAPAPAPSAALPALPAPQIAGSVEAVADATPEPAAELDAESIVEFEGEPAAEADLEAIAELERETVAAGAAIPEAEPVAAVPTAEAVVDVAIEPAVELAEYEVAVDSLGEPGVELGAEPSAEAPAEPSAEAPAGPSAIAAGLDDEPLSPEAILTPDELALIEAELGSRAAHQPEPAAPDGTLADPARLVASAPAEIVAAGSDTPPAVDSASPIEEISVAASPIAEMAPSTGDTDGHGRADGGERHLSLLGRLLHHEKPAPAAATGPTTEPVAAPPAEPAEPAEAAATRWPQPTPWAQRPVHGSVPEPELETESEREPETAPAAALDLPEPAAATVEAALDLPAPVPSASAGPETSDQVIVLAADEQAAADVPAAAGAPLDAAGPPPVVTPAPVATPDAVALSPVAPAPPAPPAPAWSLGTTWHRPPQPAPPAPVAANDSLAALLAANRAVAEQSTSAMWAESARALAAANTSGVRSCKKCALPLSTSARFCRRCGTPQAEGEHTATPARR